MTIEDSLSYNNGTLSNGTADANGDRNGYKLGGDDIAVNHVVRRSIAYHNGHHGFTYNSNPGSMTISNNVSIDNAERNYSFDAGTSVFRNNTSCRSSSGLQRQDRRQRRQLQPVLVRHERLPVLLLLRRPGLVLRRGRPPRRHLRRLAGDAIPDRSPQTSRAPPPIRRSATPTTSSTGSSPKCRESRLWRGIVAQHSDPARRYDPAAECRGQFLARRRDQPLDQQRRVALGIADHHDVAGRRGAAPGQQSLARAQRGLHAEAYDRDHHAPPPQPQQRAADDQRRHPDTDRRDSHSALSVT